MESLTLKVNNNHVFYIQLHDQNFELGRQCLEWSDSQATKQPTMSKYTMQKQSQPILVSTPMWWSNSFVQFPAIEPLPMVCQIYGNVPLPHPMGIIKQDSTTETPTIVCMEDEQRECALPTKIAQQQEEHLNRQPDNDQERKQQQEKQKKQEEQEEQRAVVVQHESSPSLTTSTHDPSISASDMLIRMHSLQDLCDKYHDRYAIHHSIADMASCLGKSLWPHDKETYLLLKASKCALESMNLPQIARLVANQHTHGQFRSIPCWYETKGGKPCRTVIKGNIQGSFPSMLSSLKRHILAKHFSVKWKCAYCPKTFMRKPSRLRHIYHVHIKWCPRCLAKVDINPKHPTVFRCTTPACQNSERPSRCNASPAQFDHEHTMQSS